MAREDPLVYYTRHGVVTDPCEQRALLADLPTGVSRLVEVIQGIMVHVYWAERYGLSLTEQRRQEAGLRSVPRILSRVHELDGRPLTVPRPPERRVVGTCRDHTVLLCAFLREQGVPARARCGFGRYFLSDHFEDHWVCEYWDDARERWILVDAQLDEVQRQALSISFDALDVPADQFLIAGRAWGLCRSGQADPDQFGIFDMHGLPFVAANVVRDTLALNRIEILPWDGWGLIDGLSLDAPVPEPDLPLLDRLADLTVDETRWPAVREVFEAERRLHTRPDWL